MTDTDRFKALCEEMGEALEECRIEIDGYIDAERPKGVSYQWDKENKWLKEQNPACSALTKYREWKDGNNASATV